MTHAWDTHAPAGDGRPSPLAIVDIGSNSIRLAVVTCDASGYLEVIEEGRALPRLIRDVRRRGTLSLASIDAVLSALRSFVAIAEGVGAGQMIVVATSAVRDATNSSELVTRAADELGLAIEVIPGTQEAEFAFLGAVHGLPVDDGMVIDVGGGSMEVVLFHDRALQQSWTLPLGAVRLTDEFALEDPPDRRALDALFAHATGIWAADGIPPLPPGAQLIGTGGTVRNLAKLDRADRTYPLPRLHGYVLAIDRLRAIIDTLGRSTIAERADLPGLNSERADTILAGAITVLGAMEASGAPELVVSGQGLREGAALHARGHRGTPLPQVRAATVARLSQQFGSSASAIDRRRVVIEAIQDACGVEMPGEMESALHHASTLLDLGRTVDYYTRHRQAEAIIVAHGLPGFSQHETALICALIRQAGSERYSSLAYEPLVTPADAPILAHAGTLLAAADDVARLMPAHRTAVEVEVTAEQITVVLGAGRGGDIQMPGTRFRRVFGRRLCVRG